MNLKVDPNRMAAHFPRTGIFVRATCNEHWVSADIATLDRESLLAWIQAKEKINPNYTYALVLTMLDHPIPANIVRATQEIKQPSASNE